MNGLLSPAGQAKDPARSRTFREVVEFYMIDFKTPLGKAIDISIIDLVAIMPTQVIMALPPSFFIHDIRFIQTIIIIFFVYSGLFYFYGKPLEPRCAEFWRRVLLHGSRHIHRGLRRYCTSI